MILYTIDDVYMLYQTMLLNHTCTGDYLCDMDNGCETFDMLVNERDAALNDIRSQGYTQISENIQWYDIKNITKEL